MDENETVSVNTVNDGQNRFEYTTVTAGEAFVSGQEKSVIEAKQLLGDPFLAQHASYTAMIAAQQIILGNSQWFRFDHAGNLVRLNGDPAISVPLSEEDRQFIRQVFANPAEVKVALGKTEEKLRKLDAYLQLDMSQQDISADCQADIQDDEVEASLDPQDEDGQAVDSEFDLDDVLDNPHSPASRRAALQARLTLNTQMRRLKQAEQIVVCMEEQGFSDQVERLREEAAAENAPKPKRWLSRIMKTAPEPVNVAPENEAQLGPAARLGALAAAAEFYPDAQEKLALVNELHASLPPQPTPEEVVAIKRELVSLLQGTPLDEKTEAAITVDSALRAGPAALARAEQAITGKLPPMMPHSFSDN